jgi:hypothetical protein
MAGAMTQTAIERSLSWRSPTTWLAAIAAVAFLAIGARAILQPLAAAAGFGVPLDPGDGLVFVQAFGARNIGISVFALLLLLLGRRRSLGLLFACGALIAAFDAGIVAAHAGAAASALRPAATALLLLAIGAGLMRGASPST